VAGEPVRLTINPEASNQIEANEVAPGEFEIRTTGSDPYLAFRTIPADAPADATVLAFEYFSGQNIAPVEVYYGERFTAEQRVSIDAITKAELFQPFAINIGGLSGGSFHPPGSKLRLDLGGKPDLKLRIRNLVLRPPTPEEQRSGAELAAEREAKLARGKLVRAYLAEPYPAKIDTVRVTPDSVTLEGDLGPDHAAAPEPFWARVFRRVFRPKESDVPDLAAARWGIAEIPPHVRVWEPEFLPEPSAPVKPGPGGTFRAEFPRRDAAGRDRLVSRWMLLEKGPSGEWHRASAARWATDVANAAERQIKRDRPANQKGLGGFVHSPEIMEDFDRAGITAGAVNFFLPGDKLFSAEGAQGAVSFEHDGRTWWFNEKRLRPIDEDLIWHTARGRVMSAIILLPKGTSRLLNHPGAAESGLYTMPNLDDPEGNAAYRALMAFLAERYTRPDKRFGRVAHWIIHNEVDFGWQWTNMGEVAMEVYLEIYLRSMRLVALEVSRYTPDASVLVSLTHHWDYSPKEPLRYYAPRPMLDLMAEFSEVEGDFPWGVAYHPYPENLLSSDPWADESPTFSFDTPKITPRNFEVLDAYLRQPRFLRGGQPRAVLFTEQGYHTPDYSEKSQALQSAALLYTFEKLRRLPIVESYFYHRWIDHPLEGGLKCGLRQLPEPGNPHGTPKKALTTYGLIGSGSPEEEAAWQEALPLIGIRSKEEIHQHPPIRTDDKP
jgi:hypothetical protein